MANQARRLLSFKSAHTEMPTWWLWRRPRLWMSAWRRSLSLCVNPTNSNFLYALLCGASSLLNSLLEPKGSFTSKLTCHDICTSTRLSQLLTRDIRHLLVRDASGKITSMFSVKDLCKCVTARHTEVQLTMTKFWI